MIRSIAGVSFFGCHVRVRTILATPLSSRNRAISNGPASDSRVGVVLRQMDSALPFRAASITPPATTSDNGTPASEGGAFSSSV